MASTKTTRDLLLEQLLGENAHVSFKDAVNGLSVDVAGTEIDGLPHTIWDLIEHIRIAQDDIIEFSQNKEYEPMEWPADYWPQSHQPENSRELEKAIDAVQTGIQTMAEMTKNPANNLRIPFEYGSGQTLFREAMLIVDHNAYHIGQIVQIRRMLNDWQ